MSLVPFLLNELLEDYRRPTFDDMIDQHFSMGLSDNFHRPVQHALTHVPLRSGYIRPWRHMTAADSGVSSLTNNKNEFKVNLDVQHFKPEELKVTVENGFILVDGKHEEKSDEHGFISRQFTRKYKVPEDVDPNAFTSKLSSDGVLSLQAPKVVKPDDNKARNIPITHTNQPLKIKDDKKSTTKTNDNMETS